MQPCHFVVHFGFHPGVWQTSPSWEDQVNATNTNVYKCTVCQSWIICPVGSKSCVLLNSTARFATTFPWGASLGWWSSQWSVGPWPCGQRLLRRYLLCFQDVLSFRNVFKDWVWKSSPATKNPCTSSLQKSFLAQKDLFLAKIRIEFSKFTTSTSSHLIGRWTDEVGAQPGCEGEGSALLCNLDRQEPHPHVLLGPSLLLMLSVGAEGHCQRL